MRGGSDDGLPQGRGEHYITLEPQHSVFFPGHGVLYLGCYLNCLLDKAPPSSRCRRWCLPTGRRNVRGVLSPIVLPFFAPQQSQQKIKRGRKYLIRTTWSHLKSFQRPCLCCCPILFGVSHAIRVHIILYISCVGAAYVCPWRYGCF